MNEPAYLLAYDVAGDARRGRLADVLLDLGASRLQRSVFWLACDEASMLRLRTTARSIIDGEEDRVNWYRVCGNCPGIVHHTRAAELPVPRDPAGSWII